MLKIEWVFLKCCQDYFTHATGESRASKRTDSIGRTGVERGRVKTGTRIMNDEKSVEHFM